MISIIAIAVVTQPCASMAQSNYEFYLFGVNLRTLKGGNWPVVIVGAIASIVTHELGHALYLESQGKDWELLSSSSALSVYTDNALTDRQYREFGRAGFALQTGIGLILTAFDKTKYLDFTKGWVFMNTIQLHTYGLRGHDIGDDFSLIKRGNGNGALEYSLCSLINQNNLKPFMSPRSRFPDVLYSYDSSRQFRKGIVSAKEFSERRQPGKALGQLDRALDKLFAEWEQALDKTDSPAESG